MAKDVLITPLDGLIQFSSSAGTGSGAIQADGDNLVISNALGDVLLGDGASDVFIGDGTNNVDIVFEQNGEIRDDGSGKSVTLGSKTTLVFISSSSDITLQEKGGNVGIGTTTATQELEVEGNISASGNLIIGDPNGKHISASNGNLEISGGYAWIHADDGGAESFLYLGSNETTGEKLFYISATDDGADKMDFKIGRFTHKWSFIGGGNTNGSHTAVEIYGQDSTSEQDFSYLKVFSPDGTNRIQLHTSGSVFFNPEGPNANIGIGTNSPVTKLQVEGDISASGVIDIGGVSGSGNISGFTSASIASGSFDGISIGNASPPPGQELVVEGNISSSGIITAEGLTITDDFSLTDDLEVGGNVSGSLTSTGSFGMGLFSNKIGIGLSNPSTPLHLSSGGTSTGSLRFINAHDVVNMNFVDNSNDSGFQITYVGTGGAEIELQADGDLLLNASNGDNVGIGTDSPLTKLDVKGDISASGDIQISSSVINTAGISGSGTLSGFTSASIASGSFDGISIGNASPPPGQELVVEGNISASGTIIAEHLETTDDLTVADDINLGDLSLISFGGSGRGKISGSALNLIVGASDVVIQTGSANTAFRVDTSAGGNIGIEGAANLIINNNITASVDSKFQWGEPGGNRVQIQDGNITASANISASGKVITTEVESPTDFSLDVEGDITFDANGADIILSDNGTDFGRFKRDSSDFIIKSEANNNDIVFRGQDGGSTITALTLDMSEAGKAIFTGDISASGNIITNVKQHIFSKTGNTDAEAQGDVVFLGGTTSMDAGKIYHYKSDGTWELADADAVATSDGLLAVALGAASDTDGMLLRGTVTLDQDPGAVGDVLFLSTTAGQATATAPSGNTDIVRVVGYCLDASNGQIWFNPSSTFVEVSA